MGGQNPYLAPVVSRLPTQKYKIRFIDRNGKEHVVEVDPAKIPYAGHGRPGSLLDTALGHHIEIDHACGGVCACSTCHVIVRDGLDTCSEPGDEEEDQLDEAYGLTANSRLACQCIPNGKKDLVVEVPAWNRNLVSEGHGEGH
jgi:ferredoxin, 2Fe-2S